MKTVCVTEGNIRERRGLLDKIKKSLSDYELFVFNNDDEYEYVEQMISEISCFEKRRLFIIKELPKISINSRKKGDKKSQMRTKVLNNFKKMLPHIPNGNIVVFDNIGISSTPFLKEVEKYGSVYKYKQKVAKDDAIKIVIGYFKKYNIEVDKDVASLMVNSLNMMGDDVDVDKLFLLLKKVYNYVYGKKIVSKKDIYALCSLSKDFVVWSLYDILDGSDNGDEKTKYYRAFKLADYFLINSRYFTHEATMLMKSMMWRYGLLLIGKSNIDLHISKKVIEEEISNIRKLKSEGKAYKIKMSPKDDKPEYSSKMVNNVLYKRCGKETLSYYTHDELLSIYQTISKSLVKIRTGCTVSEITTLLQIIFLTICGELKCKTSSGDILNHKKMSREKF